MIRSKLFRKKKVLSSALGLSKNIIYPALRRLVAEKLTRLKLRPEEISVTLWSSSAFLFQRLMLSVTKLGLSGKI